jgi:hypothetical protein
MYVYTTYARPLSVQAQYSGSCPLLSSSCYNSSLVTWTVVCLSSTTFKPLLLTTKLQSQSQSHIGTDGQSVCLSWCRAPSAAHDHILVTVWQLVFCPWGGGRPESESESHCDWRSVSLSILVSSPVCGSWPDISYCLTVTVLSLGGGALSDERMDLSSEFCSLI